MTHFVSSYKQVGRDSFIARSTIELGTIVQLVRYNPVDSSFFIEAEDEEEDIEIGISSSNHWILGWSDLIGYYAHNHSVRRPNIKYFDNLHQLLTFGNWLNDHRWFRAFQTTCLRLQTGTRLDFPEELCSYVLSQETEPPSSPISVRPKASTDGGKAITQEYRSRSLTVFQQLLKEYQVSNEVDLKAAMRRERLQHLETQQPAPYK